MRFSAAAKNSSLHDSTFEPRGADMRSEYCQKAKLECILVTRLYQCILT